MKNFVQPADVLELAAPNDVSSGDGMLVGSLFGVATKDALSGEQVNMQRVGSLSIAKLTTDVVAVGDKLNWNDTNKELQLATSDLDGVATAAEVAGNGVLEVAAVLTPV